MLISSGLIPVALAYAKSPPCTNVSYALGSGTNEPSLVFFLNINTSSAPGLLIPLISNPSLSRKIVCVVPSPVSVVVLAFGLVGLLG